MPKAGHRSFGGVYWIAIIPLAFLAITLVGMIFVLRASRKKASSPFGAEQR